MNKIETQQKDGNNIISDNNDIINTNENNQILSNNNMVSKLIKDELLYFKNDILKDMKDSIGKFQNKYSKKINEIEEKLKNFQTKSEETLNKLSVITENLSTHSINPEKFSGLEKFKTKANESLININFKIKSIENELHNSISKYDKIIVDALMFPGIIGSKNEFKNLHELLDYLLMNTRKLLISRDKEISDKKEFKKKIDDSFDMLKGQLSFCSNKVEEFNQAYKKFEEADIFNDIETLKNNAKENQQNEANMLKRIEENEKSIEIINNELTNNLKEKMQNSYLELSKEIININESIHIFQDKYNESMNEHDEMKHEIDNIKYKLNKGDNRMKLFYSDFGEDESGKIKFFGDNPAKLLLNSSDFNKIQSINHRDNNKGILSDVEEELIKDKKKFLKLNIKSQSIMKPHNLSFEDKKINNQVYYTKLRKENHQQALNYINRILEYNKEPKIKQYNNLKILKANEEAYNKKMMESNSFKNLINENDIINNNDISNIIYSNDEFFKNQSKKIETPNRNIKHLKKEKEEEKKSEEKYTIYKFEEVKASTENINKKINVPPQLKNNVNQKMPRNKILLSAKEKDVNNQSLVINAKKESVKINDQNINNNNNENYPKIEKSNRLYSSKIMKEKKKYSQMDINFDDSRMVQKRDNQKFANSINQIKDSLPLKDRDFFEERVKRFMEFSYKRPMKKNNSVSHFNSKFS